MIARTGKYRIARTVTRRYHKRDRLEASFFFFRDQQDRRHVGKLFTSLATQLAKQNALLKEYICEAVAEYRDIAHHSLRDQARSVDVLSIRAETPGFSNQWPSKSDVARLLEEWGRGVVHLGSRGMPLPSKMAGVSLGRY